MKKATQFAASLVGSLLVADAAFAGTTVLGNALGLPLGSLLGTALPIGSVGLLAVGAVALVAGIRVARRKRSK